MDQELVEALVECGLRAELAGAVVELGVESEGLERLAGKLRGPRATLARRDAAEGPLKGS